MHRISFWLGIIALMFSGCAIAAAQFSAEDLKQQVADTERSCASKSSIIVNAAFATYIADDAIFFAGKRPLRGREEIVKEWKPFYDEATPPFSWAPESVEVLASGNLALSTGPVKSPEGKEIATFTSIWRLDASGKWQVIFDKGNNACTCNVPPKSPVTQ